MIPTDAFTAFCTEHPEWDEAQARVEWEKLVGKTDTYYQESAEIAPPVDEKGEDTDGN